jgi:hypothetical protein
MRTKEWIQGKKDENIRVRTVALHRSRRRAFYMKDPSKVLQNKCVSAKGISRCRREGSGVGVVGRRNAVMATLSAMLAMSKRNIYE